MFQKIEGSVAVSQCRSVASLLGSLSPTKKRGIIKFTALVKCRTWKTW